MKASMKQKVEKLTGFFPATTNVMIVGRTLYVDNSDKSQTHKMASMLRLAGFPIVDVNDDPRGSGYMIMAKVDPK